MGCSLNSDTTNQPKVTIISQSTILPSQKSTLAHLKLSVSDLPMLSCHYIQKGALFLLPPSSPIADLIAYLISGLSHSLSLFPPLAGRLLTSPHSGEIFIASNDSGAQFTHASAPSISISDILAAGDVPQFVHDFFSLTGEVSYAGHFKPILAVQATILSDGVFIACSVNHAVADGTSFWNFFNSFADSCRGKLGVNSPNPPEFNRVNSVLVSNTAILKIPPGGPTVTFSADEPLRERIFTFSRSALLRLKSRTNNSKTKNHQNDVVSSFQSMCALIWRSVTRARRLTPSKTTTFRMAVNCRHRLSPNLDPLYFGNAIQSTPTTAAAGEVVARDIRWCGELLRRSVAAHDDGRVRGNVKAWEEEPRCFPLGNFDGAMITMGSSPRFPMYEGDFGWGRPVAVRSGRANKFDGKMSAFPGRCGDGSVDVEIVLCELTMAALEADPEFLNYVSC